MLLGFWYASCSSAKDIAAFGTMRLLSMVRLPLFFLLLAACAGQDPFDPASFAGPTVRLNGDVRSGVAISGPAPEETPSGVAANVGQGSLAPKNGVRVLSSSAVIDAIAKTNEGIGGTADKVGDGAAAKWFPHLGELTADTFEPVDQVLSGGAIPPSVRTEVESFLRGLDVVDSLPVAARQLANQENIDSQALNGVDQLRVSGQANSPLRIDTQTLAGSPAKTADGSSLSDLDTAARVWQYTTASALQAAGTNRSQQFKDALLLLLSGRYRDYGSASVPAVNESCPTRAPPPACDACSPYRTADGTCNNLRNPLFGSASTALRRFARPAYADGVGEPRTKSVTGRNLPSARQVSLSVVSRRSSLSSQYTHLVMQWGQLVDHDLSLTPAIAGVEGIGLTCCADDVPGGAGNATQNSSLSNRQGCFNIPVPAGDPSFSGRRCLGFSRSSTVPASDCQLGQRSPINMLTSHMDASMVYGSSQTAQNNLRSFSGGRLKTQELPGRRSLLPKNPASLCASRSPTNVCFLAGDGRVNQLPGLMSLQTVTLREHNRLAGELQKLNPQWSDEKLFQEARKIVAAEIQHITYNEFLPIVVGPYLYNIYGLRPGTGSNYYGGYNPIVDTAIRAEFSTVAYRFGHSLIRNTFSLDNTAHQSVAHFVPKDNFFTPDLIYDRNFTESSVIRGLCRDPMERFDYRMTAQVVEHMFEATRLPNTPLDLASLNIQRGRDQGIPSYVSLRRTFGMSVPTTFEHLLETHDYEVVRSLRSVYEDVRDIDAFVGGIGERSLPGAVLGPLFARIVAIQFALTKTGDRFFYENDCSSAFPTSCNRSTGASGRRCLFTPEQLSQLRNATLSRLLCDNSDIPTIQLNAFKQDSIYHPCAALPLVNLQAWKGV